MAYMYILECCDGSFYTGSTKNLPRRLWQHHNGMGANHTAKRLPVKLVYAEGFECVEDAFYREKQVQGWSRAKKMALMQGEWDKLRVLAECQNESRGWGVGFDSPLRQAQGIASTCSGQSAQPANISVEENKDSRAERSRSPDWIPVHARLGRSRNGYGFGMDGRLKMSRELEHVAIIVLHFRIYHRWIRKLSSSQ